MRRPREESEAEVQEHRRLLHELEVHQIELGMQNQALRDDREQLERSRARYAQLYDFAPVGHLTLGRTGTIQELNLTCAALLGKDRRALEGVSLRAIVAPPSRSQLDAHIRACLKSKAPVAVELMIPLAGGGFRAVELMSVPPAETADATFPVFHSVMIDISARKRDDERRDQLLRNEREARVLAESVNRAKEDFLAIVSHELRTPLVPMMMWIKALRAGGMSDSLRGRAIEAIDACLETQVAMIDDLVDVARGQHGKLRVQRRPLDLQPIVSTALETIAPSAASKQIKLTLEVDPRPVWVAGDGLRLRQIVGNLLSNAVKFTREAGLIDVSLHTEDDHVVLSVRDDGEGIDPAMLPDVFEPFRQNELGTARRHGGLGLGLTIVRHLVEQHEGQVTAESEGLGRGSCFTITLPRCEARARLGADTYTPSPAAFQATPFDLIGIRVLVVEDHTATREALQVALETEGAIVTTAASAAAGRDEIERSRPHILVSDIGMPAEDGYSFIRKLRHGETTAEGPRLPAVALTAHGTQNDRALALAAGFDGHIAKPIDFERLVSLLATLARGWSGSGP